MADALPAQPDVAPSSLRSCLLRGCASGTVRRLVAALLLGLLISRASRWLGRPRRRAPPACRRQAQARGRGPCELGDTPVPADKRLRFKSTVSCCVVPNLCYLTEEKKAKLWWHQQDFAQFLKTRVEIGRAYTAVAKSRGIAVDSAFPPEPALAHESRRGLGLGRKKQRDRNRQRYIKAVLDEQARQRREVLKYVDDLENALPGGGAFQDFVLDAEKLSEVAMRCSESDRRYAVAQAREDYERTAREPDAPQSGPARPGAAAWAPPLQAPPSPSGVACEGEDAEGVPPFVRVDSIRLADGGAEEGTPLATLQGGMERYVSPSVSASKGFGLSRGELEQAGLSATGHLVSRRAAAARGSDGEEGDAGAASDVSASDTGASDVSDGTDLDFN